MTNRILPFSILLVLIASCVMDQQEIIDTLTINQVLHATIENSGDSGTRVFVDERLRVLWNADDRISAFNKTTYNREYCFEGQDGDNSGAFKIVTGDNFVTSNPLDYVYAVYPYNEETKISNDGEITVYLPAEQRYRENSFGLGTNTMVAVSQGDELTFKNLCGYFSIKLYGDNVSVSSISLKGNNNEFLAGKATVVTQINSDPTLQFDSTDATKEIALTLNTPVTIGSTAETATSFWFVIPPTLFTNGFTLTVTDASNRVFEKRTLGALEIKRNTLKKSSALEVIPDSSSGNIVFADEKVKAKLVAAFDSNQDGELSYAEAAAVSSEDELKAAFGSIKTYKSFDEFQYFTSISRLASSMFENWNRLTSIVLPPSLTCVSESSFFGCVSIESIVVPERVTDIKSSAFYGCSRLTNIFIPEGVTSIGHNTFNGCSSLISITIPDSVMSIGSGAFYGCTSLIRIIIPKGVTTIDMLSFCGCSSLISITIPESVTSIGNYAFYGCLSLTDITLPEGIMSIGNHAFTDCSDLTCISIPERVTSIGDYTFSGCSSITSITIPESVSSIGSAAFFCCTSLNSITIPESVATIGDNAFNRCTSLISITLPESVTSISMHTFRDCSSLISITIPESVTSIGNYSFYGCSSLTHILIPNSVTSIGEGAFQECSSLTNFKILQKTPPKIDSSSLFHNTNYSLIIYVPMGSLELYKTAQYWSEYSDRIQAITTVPIPNAIDLGLSVKWASFNIGASKPEELGNYYAWGEVEEKKREEYNWGGYVFCKGDDHSLTKYCNNSEYGYNGFKDGLSTLELEDDVAHVLLGSPWRMPTWLEIMELQQRCEWTWTTRDGWNGYVIKSLVNDNSIFIPACGQGVNSQSVIVAKINQEGRYWSSSLLSGLPMNSIILIFDSDEVKMLNGSSYYVLPRFHGLAIRPVCN